MAIECLKCHTENPSENSFCSKCGASLGVDLGSLSPTRTILGPVLHLKKGQIIGGKYKIIQKIGEGGMGIVYKAEDTKLKRNVALKFLASELTRDKKAKARFIQEAQAAAALNHPHICIIHEVDETDSQTFIAMEFIEGQTLKDKIESGALAVKEAIDMACQVAEGLGEAHKKGIVHRDIKPANIMLTEKGQAKIMDFGLAKLSWGADLTKPSMIMGTVAYMSPEQARGEPVDLRTDIWSLGAMLYEMLTGEKPFQKSQEQALIYAILNEKPTPISVHRPDIPSHIERAIDRSLAKKAEERYQKAGEFIKDLKKSQPIAFAKAEKSIVVLPFDDMSPNKDNEYFSDGLTEEIITDLSKIISLKVISRNSAMVYKGTRKATKSIGAELGVQYILEGSVRKSGNNLRIVAQLIDATSDVHLWAEKYTGILDDIFDIQEKVSRSIVDVLKIKLSPEESEKITTKPIPDFYAYECYLKALYEIQQWTEDGLNNALKYLQNGMELVGENAVLLSGIGYVNYQYVNMGLKEEELYLQKAEEYARRALELDKESPYGHIVLGLRKGSWGRKFQDGIRHFKRALAVLPNDFDAIYWLLAYYAHSGKIDTSNLYYERLKEIDPLNPWTQYFPGWLCMWEGRFELALELHRKSYELYPFIPPIRWYYALNLGYNHQIDEACFHFEGTSKDNPNAFFYRLGAVLALALKHKKEEVFSSLKTSGLEAWARRNFAFSYYIAECYALINEKEKAIDWLEISVNCGLVNYPFFNEYDPFLENIRSEPRFKKLMERVKHEWENFEV